MVPAILATYGCSSYKSFKAVSLGAQALNANTAFLVKLQRMPMSVYTNDPDDPTLLLPVVDTLHSTLALMQMKSYLQSITIEPDSTALITIAVRIGNPAAIGSNAFGEALVSTQKNLKPCQSNNYRDFIITSIFRILINQQFYIGNF